MMAAPGSSLRKRGATRPVILSAEIDRPFSSIRIARSASPSNATPRSQPCSLTAFSTSTRFSCLRGFASWFGKRAVELEVERHQIDVELLEDRQVDRGHAVGGVGGELEPRLRHGHLCEHVVGVLVEDRPLLLSRLWRQIGGDIGGLSPDLSSLSIPVS